MVTSSEILRLNVGFIIHENIGYSRDFPIEVEYILLPPDLTLRNLRGTVRVSRAVQGLLVQTVMSAQVEAECGRCLDPMLQSLQVEFTELYAFNRKGVTESGLRVPETGKIDLAPMLREEMLLAIPINPVCRIDCNGLCLVCGENLNLVPHVHTDLELSNLP
jgi:uncharacterized protein